MTARRKRRAPAGAATTPPPPSRLRRRLVAALVAVAAIAGVWLVAGRSRAPRRSLLLDTIDTLRADRVGAYGYAAAETPALDGLARRGHEDEVGEQEERVPNFVRKTKPQWTGKLRHCFTSRTR